jgi:uncharacterized membrane protein
MAETVGDILAKIWNWVVVGEEYRRPGVSLEVAVARTWLLRASIVMLVGGVGYFLKWSFDHGLIGPAGRIAISIVVGIVMLAGGIRLLGRKYGVIGQGLMGGGIATLYFSAYAAGPLYHVIPSMAAVFGLMILVTAAAGTVAVRYSSLLIAVLGIVGGLGTPVMLRSATPNAPVLYAYLLLLSAGILGVALLRPWRLLNYLGLLGTAVLVGATAHTVERAQFPAVIVLLALLFVLHSALVYVYNLPRRGRSTVLEIVHLTASAAFFGWMGYGIVLSLFGRPYPALVALAMALYFVLHLAVFLRLRVADRNLLVTLIALAGLFTVLTMPLIMEKESLTLSWALLALAFLWLGQRVDSGFLRQAARALYLLVFWRLAALDMPAGFRHTGRGPLPPMGEYWKAMADRLWTFGVSIGSVIAAFLLQWRENRRRPPDSGAAAVPPKARRFDRMATGVFYWSALALLFVYLTLEVNTLLHWKVPVFQKGGVSVLWTLFAIAFVVGGIWREIRGLRYLGLALFGVVVGKVFLADLRATPMIFRVVAFLIIGVALLVGSFLYVQAAGRLSRKGGSG